jgi:hypothetical protein
MKRIHLWAVVSLLAAACGGGGDGDAGTTTTTSATLTLITTTTLAPSTTTTAATTTTFDVPLVTMPPDVVAGTGDIQVTLIWNTDSDMDLRVVEPSGFEISHHTPESESGGRLDLDTIPAAGDPGPHVENVFWPAGSAPSGRYFAYVQHYGSNGTNPGPYTLEVRVEGELIHQETGLIPMYENSTYFEFAFAG